MVCGIEDHPFGKRDGRTAGDEQQAADDDHQDRDFNIEGDVADLSQDGEGAGDEEEGADQDGGLVDPADGERGQTGDCQAENPDPVESGYDVECRQ